MLAALVLACLALGATQDPLRHPAAPESRPDAQVADFELADVAGETFRLERACAEGWVLIVVVRGMW